MKPAFTYYGGKQRMGKKIMGLLPEQELYSGYCEPFCGGATLFWSRPFNKKCVDTLNDTNNSVINFFRVLRDPIQAMHLHRMLFFTPYSRDVHKEAADITAGRINETIKGDVEKAWAFCTDIMQGFNCSADNGFCYRKKAGGNEPFRQDNAKQKISPDVEKAWAFWTDIMQGFAKIADCGWGNTKQPAGGALNVTQTTKTENRKEALSPEIAHKFLYQFFQPLHQLVEISAYTERLKMVQLENIDALACIKKYDTEHTLFYIDPPYPGTNQGHYGGYMQEDLEKLVFLLTTIRGSFLLSNYPSEFVDEIAKQQGWERFEFSASCSAAKNTRQKRVEVVWRKLNNNMKNK